MVSDKKLKYFVGRIKELERIQSDKIHAAFPSTDVNVVNCILNGSVPMRSKTEIKDILAEKEKNNRYGVTELRLREVFNFETIDTKNKVKSDENKVIREELISKLKQDTIDLIDITYFSEEPMLLEKLNSFKNKDYTRF